MVSGNKDRAASAAQTTGDDKLQGKRKKKNRLSDDGVERVSGGSGPLMSTPKHSEMSRPLPLFDADPISRISDTPPQKTMVVKKQGTSQESKAVLSLVNRSYPYLYFGFVAIGDSQVIEHRLLNVSAEQLRVRCSLEPVRERSVFKIFSVSSMTLEPGSELAINVRYQPTSLDVNADTKLVVERTNGDYQRYSFRLIGYGGKGDLRVHEQHFKMGVAHSTPSGVVVLLPDFYPPPPAACPARFTFNVTNNGIRPCFASVRALRTHNDQELSHEYVTVIPSKFVIHTGQKNTQPILVRVNEQLSGKPTADHARCFGAPSNTPASEDVEFRLFIIWGEENHRQKVKIWEAQHSRKCIAYGQSFTEERFSGENVDPPPNTQSDRPFENEDEEFVNSLRVIRVNIVDNRAISRFPAIPVPKKIGATRQRQ